MRALLDKKGFDRRPHNIAPDAWYYEERHGLEIHWVTLNGNSRLVCIIPWRSLKEALNRKSKREKK